MNTKIFLNRVSQSNSGREHQQRLAELADVNIRYVQRIEAGEIDALFSTIARIRKALECSWDELTPKEKAG